MTFPLMKKSLSGQSDPPRPGGDLIREVEFHRTQSASGA